jgi:hypothetical protein
MAKAKRTTKKKKSNNPCWEGYTKLGMKIKNGKKVPDCVPEKQGK